MKIIHIINSLGTGGAEKLLVDTLPLYIQNGISVELLLLNGTRTPFFEQLAKTPNFTIHQLGRRSMFNPFLIFRIIPFLKKYEIAHVHLFPALYWVALAKFLSGSKIKLVFTKHSTSNRRMDFSLFTKAVEKWMMKKYSRIVTISPEADFHLKKYFKSPSNRFILIENGINIAEIEKAYPSKESFFGIKDESQKIIIQVSSFRIPKDQPTVLKALALLPQHIKLLFAGDGPQRAACEKLSEELGVEERVKFLGSRTDIPPLLKASDVVVLSTNFEGFGLAIIEGMACGKPVVASDVPGVRDVVGEAGVLFQKGNEKMLAKYITDLITDPVFYDKVAYRCLQRSKNYDINVMVRKHISLYKQVIKT